MWRHESYRSMRKTRATVFTKRPGQASSISTRSWPTSRSLFTTMTRPRWAAGSHCSQPSPSSHSLLSHSCLRCHKNVRCSIFCTNTSWILTELWRLLVQQVTYQENIKIRKYLQKAKRHLNHLFLYFNGIPVNSSKKKSYQLWKYLYVKRWSRGKCCIYIQF